MLDDNRWERLLLHVLTELETETDEDPIAVERAAVHLYGAIWRRLEHPEETE